MPASNDDLTENKTAHGDGNGSGAWRSLVEDLSARSSSKQAAGWLAGQVGGLWKSGSLGRAEAAGLRRLQAAVEAWLGTAHDGGASPP